MLLCKSTLNRFIHQRSVLLFGVFVIAAAIAFWPGYFGRILQEPEYQVHFHGLSMAIWCVMLIAQASFIHLNYKRIHRLLGLASYVIAPMVIVSTFHLVHHRLVGGPIDNPFFLSTCALMINGTIAFAVIYCLAIYHRNTPAIHARYMISTIFPLFTPVTDRIIYMHLPSLIKYAPVIDGRPVVPALGFILAELILLILALWDYLSGNRHKAFWIALIVLLVYHLTVLYLYQFKWWHMIATWFLELPLS